VEPLAAGPAEASERHPRATRGAATVPATSSHLTAGHGLGDRRIRGLLFDYGLTLVTFERPDAALLASFGTIVQRLREAGVAPVPEAETLLREVHDHIEVAVARHERAGHLEEIDLVGEERIAYARCGLHLPDQLLDEVVDLVQQAWWEGIRVPPGAVEVLGELRRSGVRIGLCSNAPYRSRSLHAQLEHLGLLDCFDSVTFSSEVGRRKPAPEIFNAALDSLGVDAASCAMVGDRRREDVAGARAVGMGTIRTREHHDDPGPGDADVVIDRLGDLVAVIRRQHEDGRRGSVGTDTESGHRR
jgi:HAD superfamily hydrolase (TIGR01549 family)